MSKLTPPAIQNSERRRKFFQKHLELPNAKTELDKLDKLATVKKSKTIKILFKNMFLKRKGKKIKTKGAFGRPPEFMIKKIELEVI